MSLLNALSLLGACNPLIAQTNTPQSTTFIGYYVETTPINTEMWIRIDEEEEDVLFVADAAGREILVNFDQNGAPILFYKATPELGRH